MKLDIGAWRISGGLRIIKFLMRRRFAIRSRLSRSDSVWFCL